MQSLKLFDLALTRQSRAHLQKDAAAALTGMNRFFGRVSRAQPLALHLPPQLQHSFVLPPPMLQRVGGRLPSGDGEAWRLQQQGMLTTQQRRGNGTLTAQQLGRLSRGAGGGGLTNGQPGGGWHPGVLPLDIHRAHAAATAAGQLPNLQRSSQGQQPQYGSGRDAAERGRLPASAAGSGSMRSKSSQAVGAAGSAFDGMRPDRGRQVRSQASALPLGCVVPVLFRPTCAIVRGEVTVTAFHKTPIQ